jgi:hypothetical protein
MVKKGLRPAEKQAQAYHEAVIAQMLKLTTNGFGLVAALAWNNVIKEIVDEYIKPFVGNGSGLASLFIYALLVTTLAVTATLQLSQLKTALAKKPKPEQEDEE